MTGIADIHLQFRFDTARHETISAAAGDFTVNVFWMNSLFHYDRPPQAHHVSWDIQLAHPLPCDNGEPLAPRAIMSIDHVDQARPPRCLNEPLKTIGEPPRQFRNLDFSPSFRGRQ